MIRMKMVGAISATVGLLWLATATAQAPADAPAGSTGLCKDGSYTSASSKRGACSGHHGVQTWYASSGSSTSGGSTASAPAAAPVQPTQAAPMTAAPAAQAQPTPSAPATAPASDSKWTPPATAAPGGGPGLVWVNKNSKVYHCPGDRWYGKTKNGAYESEAAAKAEGDRPDHNKPCT